MKRSIIFFAMVAVSLFSCMKERGNYNYEDVNKVWVDTIHSRVLSQFDTLRLTPTITQTMEEDENNLEYLWYWYRGDVDERIIDTLSHERNLVYYAGDEPGKYNLRLKVTDKKNGLFFRIETDVTISGGNSGLLVLSNLAGKANVLIVNEAGDVFQDIYYAANGEYAGENPVAIHCVDICQKLGMQEIVVMCNDLRGGVCLNYNSFVKERDVRKLFFTQPSTVNLQDYSWSGSEFISMDYDFLINDGRLHAREFVNIGVTNPNESLYLPAIIGDYYLSPYTFINSNTLLFYDNKNYCFKVLACARGNIGSNTFSPAPLENEAEVGKMPFNPRNVGMELVFGGEGWRTSGTVGFGYGIFRKPGSTSLSDMYCMKFNIGVKMSFTPPYGEYFVPYSKKAITQAPGLNEAKTFALSKRDPYLYYAHNNIVYSYDVEYDRAKPIYNLDTVVNVGSKVDFIYLREGRDLAYSDKIWVGSSEGSNDKKRGSLHVLNIGRNGDVERRDTVYHNICGKVVGMSYKYR